MRESDTHDPASPADVSAKIVAAYMEHRIAQRFNFAMERGNGIPIDRRYVSRSVKPHGPNGHVTWSSLNRPRVIAGACIGIVPVVIVASLLLTGVVGFSHKYLWFVLAIGGFAIATTWQLLHWHTVEACDTDHESLVIRTRGVLGTRSGRVKRDECCIVLLGGLVGIRWGIMTSRVLLVFLTRDRLCVMGVSKKSAPDDVLYTALADIGDVLNIAVADHRDLMVPVQL